MENPVRRSFRKFPDLPAALARLGENNGFFRQYIAGIMPAFPHVPDNGL